MSFDKYIHVTSTKLKITSAPQKVPLGLILDRHPSTHLVLDHCFLCCRIDFRMKELHVNGTEPCSTTLTI